MVDVSAKAETNRTAVASAVVNVGKTAFLKIQKNQIQKGDVLSVARIAGIQSVKKTAELIPLCHNIFISRVELSLVLRKKNYTIEITSTVSSTSVTGVEMEALTAVSVAALTIYDMCKAVTKGITISKIQLISKTGGKSGTYTR